MKTVIAFIGLFVAAQAQIDWENVYHIEQLVRLPGSPENVKPTAGRIVNGEIAKPGQYPHQAGLIAQIGNKQGFCGGSVISPNYILTAAHCVETASNVTVVLGTNEVMGNEESKVEIQSSKFKVHPEWSMARLVNDIAIISLPSPVELNEKIAQIRLPKRSDVGVTFEDYQSIITGWGKTSTGSNTISKELRSSQNHILSNKKCGKLLLGMKIPPTQICQSGKGKRGACSGDSGGPLVTYEADGKPVQLGITSYGVAFGCALGLPTSYTRVSEYLDFIKANTDVQIRGD